MIGLEQEDEIEEITFPHEIWWYDLSLPWSGSVYEMATLN